MNPYLKKMKEVKAKIDELFDNATKEERVFTDEEKTSHDALKAEYEGFKAMADDWSANNKAGDDIKAPANNGTSIPASRIEVTDKKAGPFVNLVDQLSAVKSFVTTGNVDDRLNTVNAALGMNEGVSKEGGWAVQSDFAGMMLDTAVKEDPLLKLVDSYQVSSKANSVEWVDIDETEIESSVFGGVQVFWSAEAAGATATHPTLKEKELKLQKLMGFAYTTFELNKDSDFIDKLYNRAFNTAIQRAMGAAIIEGSGVGKPLGFRNATALESVAKKSGQAADTILWDNISGMYHRAIDKTGMIWVMHPDVHEQLDFLKFPVGTGGVPVYLPATQTGTIDTLRGKPIIDSDHCAALGDKGDILFVDPKEYVLLYKGGVQKDVSIHVQFLTAENAFRFIFRANGIPKRSSSLQIKNSSRKRSPYITLDARG